MRSDSDEYNLFGSRFTLDFVDQQKITGQHAPALQLRQTVVRIDPRYFRPTEVDTLLGDPAKAQLKLGWVPEITALQMCEEMVASDLQEAKRHAQLKANRYQVPVSTEWAKKLPTDRSVPGNRVISHQNQ